MNTGPRLIAAVALVMTGTLAHAQTVSIPIMPDGAALLAMLIFYIVLLTVLYQALQRDREYGSTLRDRALVLIHPTIIVVAISALGPVLEVLCKDIVLDNTSIISAYDFAFIVLDAIYSFAIPTGIIFCLLLLRSKKRSRKITIQGITIQRILAIYISSVVAADLLRHLSRIVSIKWHGIPVDIATEVKGVVLSLVFDFVGAILGGILIFACFRFYFHQQTGKILFKTPATTYSWFMFPLYSLFVLVIVFGLFVHIPDVRYVYTQTNWHDLKIRVREGADNEMYAYFKPRFTIMGFHAPSTNEVVKVELYKDDGNDTGKASGINAVLKGIGPKEISRLRKEWPPENLAERISRVVKDLIAAKDQLITRAYSLKELSAQKEAYWFGAMSNKSIPVRIALQTDDGITVINSLDDPQYDFLGFGDMPDTRDWVVVASERPLCSVVSLDADTFFGFNQKGALETAYADAVNVVVLGKDAEGHLINITRDLVNASKQQIEEHGSRYVWPEFYSTDRGTMAKLCVTTLLFTDGPLLFKDVSIGTLDFRTGDGIIRMGIDKKPVKKGQGLRIIGRQTRLNANSGEINISGDGLVLLGGNLLNPHPYERIPIVLLRAMATALVGGFGVILVFAFRESKG